MFLYGVSIFWLIFLYIDIKRYAKRLDKYVQNILKTKHDNKNEGIAENSEYYSVKNLLDKSWHQDKSQSNSDYFPLHDYQNGLRRTRYSIIQRELSKKPNKKNPAKLSTIEEDGHTKRKSSGDVYYMAESLNENKNEELSEFEEANNDAESNSNYSDTDIKMDDHTKKGKFTGYLNEKSASYNLYLRVGIGGKINYLHFFVYCKF